MSAIDKSPKKHERDDRSRGAAAGGNQPGRNHERDERSREEPRRRDAARDGGAVRISVVHPEAKRVGGDGVRAAGMKTDGNGWVHCAQGHRHWGRFGAAGLLIVDERQAVLQHRAPWTHEGDTWGLPGGARDSHEDVVAAALREAYEEGEIPSDAVTPLGWWRDDHGGWSYTTIVAQPCGGITPHAANAESTEIRWWPVGDIDRLPLHRGFAAAWPRLRHPPARLVLVVDAANVVGSRPDGWWHDRLGAARRLRDQLGGVAREGIATPTLPHGVSAGALEGLLPEIRLVVEGAARPLAGEPAGDNWWDTAVTVVAARHDGDTAVVETAAVAAAAGHQTIVVSADRGLRRRLVDGAQTAGPTWLFEQLAPAAT